MSPASSEMSDLGALAALAPELAATFASIASDIALVIGPDGVIRNVALGEAALKRQATQWVGQPFIDTVTDDTRIKITQLLQEVGSTGISRRREVNLPGAEGLDIPMAFAAIRLGAGGPVLAVGRDLRAIAAIQQRFVEAQQELERDYWKQRQAESRYRLLFQVATDAVLVVDALTLSIVEANHSAAALFGATPEQLAGRQASAAIDPLSRPAVDELLVTARASGRPAEIRARLARRADATGTALVDVSATPFRATVDGASVMLLLVRARGSAPRSGDPAQQLAEFVEHTPDAVAITDSSGRVQMANPAFLTLCRHGSTENRIKGLALGEALGDPGLRLGPLVGEVRRLGIATRVRARIGGAGVDGCEVEVSAALLAEGDQECIGFTLRRLGLPRTTGDLPALEGLAQAIDGLAEQLGRVSLPELMQEASHLAERHLILGALQQARGRLADAADWLGITPDSLGLRLRRHGLTAAAGQHQPPSLLN